MGEADVVRGDPEGQREVHGPDLGLEAQLAANCLGDQLVGPLAHVGMLRGRGRANGQYHQESEQTPDDAESAWSAPRHQTPSTRFVARICHSFDVLSTPVCSTAWVAGFDTSR